MTLERKIFFADLLNRAVPWGSSFRRVNGFVFQTVFGDVLSFVIRK